MREINASDLPRIMACNGSLQLSEPEFKPNDFGSPIRAEGIAAHWLVSTCLENGEYPQNYLNQQAPNQVFITDEIVEMCEICLDRMNWHVDSRDIEYEINFVLGDVTIKTRADLVRVSNHVVDVFDFKFGWRIVEPEMNWTLIAYALANVIDRGLFLSNQFHFTIVQPRPYHSDGPIRTWSITVEEFNILRDELEATLNNPTDELRTGTHCNKCPHLAHCPAARQAGLNGVESSVASFTEDIPNDALSFELLNLIAAKRAIDERYSALEELAKHRLQKGDVIENFALQRKLGHTTWNTGLTPELVQVLTGVDVSAPKMITPNQALKKGASEDVVKSLTYRPQLGTSLKQISADKIARIYFKHHQGE